MFWLKKDNFKPKSYNKNEKRPVIRASICTGEKTACFQNIKTGHLEEVMLIHNDDDLKAFIREYGLNASDIKTIY